ncbi:cytochrome [Mycobacterium colombiense]|uniref:Cytochrome n=1 Tax=Mycobacterium colombiense TaxID=339268 RepID=A0A1A2RLD3_9MYCO|nr:cytochrome P450 [Mycobacterium colombiense]OBH52689.1 cytochrome [Mycobacterium colombiense]
MTVASEIYYDPYDVELNADPYPMFARLREQAPLYYNEQHDFYAVSRFDDVNRGIMDHDTYSSARGAILEIIKAGIEIPSGTLVFEDPPVHNIHRKLLSRMFTPRRVTILESKIREFCARAMDPLVGTGHFDFVTDLGAQIPIRVIGMLLGIPEAEQRSLVDSESTLETEPGRPMTENANGPIATGECFTDYVEYRIKHPSDDLITELMNAEFEDETGTIRRLAREELQMYLTVIANAGSDTVTRFLGWAGKVLAEHPDQRRELVADRSLLPQVVEELLRFEPPAPHVARYVTRDVELYDTIIPAGSVMMMLIGAANRDHRRFAPDGDVFDIHRAARSHLGFGGGTHFCLGNNLARLEARVALDEILNRFPEWDVDLAAARLSSTSTVRGWESLPTLVP